MEVSQDYSSATLDESYHWTENRCRASAVFRRRAAGLDRRHRQRPGQRRRLSTNAEGYSREDATVSTWSTSGGGTVRDMNLLFGGASTFISGSWAEDHYDETFNWTRHDANSGSTAWTTSLSGSGNHVWGGFRVVGDRLGRVDQVNITTPGSTSSSASGTWGETESSVSHYDGYTAYNNNGFYIAASGNAPGGPYLDDNQFHETFTDSDPPVLPHADSGTGAGTGSPISSTNPIPPGGWVTITPTNPSTAPSGVASLQVTFKPILAYAAGGEVDFTTIKTSPTRPRRKRASWSKRPTPSSARSARPTTGWRTPRRTSSPAASKAANWAINDGLDMASDFFSGFADTLTGGLTERYRNGIGANYVNKNSTAYGAGQVAGTAESIALSCVNPCGAGAWAGVGIKALNAVEFAGNGFNLVDDLSQHKYGAAAMDTVGMIANASQILRACFAFETPMMVVEDGQRVGRRAEDVRKHDFILASPEDDPSGPVVPCRVEEVFVNTSAVIRISILGRVIRSTPQHRVYVRGRDWIEVSQLKPGDEFRSEDNRWLPIASIEDRGEVVPVYNFRIEPYHTYFVGSPEWGFSIWAHNTCDGLNHYWPKFMGSKLPNGSKALTFFRQIGHIAIHRAMNRFLKPLGMAASKAKPGKEIIRAFSPTERLRALVQFYKEYQGGVHLPGFLEEVRTTIRSGRFR